MARSSVNIRFVMMMLFLLAMLSTLSGNGSDSSVSIYSSFVASDYVTHGPITITNDADFGLQGFTGEGTEENPYIIGGYLFSAYAGSNINITGTTKCFQICDNYFEDSPYTREVVYIENTENFIMNSNTFAADEVNYHIRACTNFLVYNNSFNNGLLYYGGDYKFYNNTFIKEGYFSGTGDCIIANNTCLTGGIDLVGGDNITATQNTVGGKPMHLLTRVNNTEIDCSSLGQIALYYCHNITLRNGEFENVSRTIVPNYCDNITIQDSSFSGCWAATLVFYSDYVSFLNCNVSSKPTAPLHHAYGVYTTTSVGLVVANNSFSQCAQHAIYPFVSSEIVIRNNTLASNANGIWMQDSIDSIIDDNSIAHSFYGIRDYHGSNNTYTDNTIQYCSTVGFLVEESISKIVIESNEFKECGLSIQSYSLEGFIHNVTDNTVNDRLLFYGENLSSAVIPQDTGQIWLVNCSNIQGSGVNVSASTTGCSIVFSDTISLDDVESNYNDFGFDMFYSDAVIISNSTVIGADEGVHFYACNYCEVQNCTILDCTDYGIHDIAGYYLIVNDNEIHNNAEGIWVTTTGGIFSNNTVSGHYGSGHAIYCQGWDCIIDNNTCSDYWAGIRIVINTNNTIRNNHVYNTGHGIHLYYSSNITVQHNYVENGDQCIDLYYSHNVTVEDNTCNDHVPFYLLGSDNNTFRSNTIMNYVNYGIRIDNSSSNIVEDSIFTSSANYGVLLYYCSETTLSNLTIENVINKGIYLHYSSMSIINKCIIRNCEYAIHSYYCLSTTCNASTLEDCSLYGMFNERSSGTTMTFNNISRCEYGLEIYISDDCIAAINTVVDCQTGIMITGTHNTLTANVLSRSGVFLESQYMTVSGNWVDGKPIGYFANLTSGTYDCSGFGQVFFVNCDNLDIHSGIFENVSFGLVLADCDYSTVHDIYVNYPYRIGIYLIRGYSCTLENFTCINSSGSGVWTYQTDQCTVRNGTTFNNAVWGVYIRESPNTIVANITSNGDGIDIYASNYSVVEDCVIANSNLMGLLIQGSDYCEIQFNTIWNSGEAALAIYSSSHTYAAYNNLSDSYWPANVRIQDSYNTTIYWNHILHDEYYDGILITNSDYNYIINNTILDNGCYGIRVESTSTNCHIYSNIIAYNGVENAWDDGASNSWDNGIHGNKWNDYSGIGTYAIPGSALSVDHYPQLYDTFAPTIDSPSDVTYDAGESGASITWAPRDGHPSTFQIYRNGTSIASGPWGGGDIPIDVDGLGIGTYNYTLKVTDLAGNVKIDTVYVFVRFDSKPPTLDQPADFQYSEFVAGNVSWMPLDVHPSSYDIYQDSILITSSPWDGGDISYAFNLTMGAYNFTIVVFDTVGNNVADTVFVTILDDSPPVIIGPDDFLVFLGTIDEVLRWNVTDAHPNTAIVYKNGTQVVTANFYGTFANVSINTLIEGVFNYTVIVWDTSGNNARNTVWITIWNPDFPFIDHPDDIEFVEGTAGNYLEWNPISNQPDTYSIEVNGTEKKSGIWSVNITINLDDFAVGIHNITAIVWSQTGNSATDTVFLRVLYNPPPEIDSPADLMYVESIGLGQITWHPTDDNPNWWYLYINGTLRSDGGWTGGKVVGNVSYLSHGIYNATLVVEDIGGKTISDTVYVRVVYELNPPVIAGPADLSYTFGDTGNVLSWGAFDEHPSHLLVYSNGTIVDTRAWDGSVITTSVDGLEPGVHNITLLLYDIDLNSNSDTVMVFVENIQPPTLSLQPDVTTQQGADSQLNWNPSSLFPDHYEIYVNGSMDVSTTWNGGSISYDLKYLEPGVYNITLVVYDQAGNSASDSVWVHIEGMGALPDFMSPLIQAGSVVTILVVIAAAYRIFKQAGQSKEESDWRSMMDDFGH